MSFVDLATLALHRRNEMEVRIQLLSSKCDQAVKNILKLKAQSQNFVHQLNCDPEQLKERFLNCMKQLDEYTYLITDFNLACGKLEETDGVEIAPEHDTSTPLSPTLAPLAYNIIDMLSEPTPSKSLACPNQCPLEKPKYRKIRKFEQQLIQFSSASSSAESVLMVQSAIEKEVQCEITDDLNKLAVSDADTLSWESRNLPAQTVLKTDQVYPAMIMNIDGASFWVTTNNSNDVYKQNERVITKFKEVFTPDVFSAADCEQALMVDMTKYYKENRVEVTLDDIVGMNYCAFFDSGNDWYYRALYMRFIEEDELLAEVFLVDTGEVRIAPATKSLQPLVPQFCVAPPYARCCHLAGIDLSSHSDKDLLTKLEEFMKQYIGSHCSIEVDDNTSESLGVYVMLLDKRLLNNVLVEEGLAYKIPSEVPALTAPVVTEPVEHDVPAAEPTRGPPELAAASSSTLDMGQTPEYDDPVEAVMGFKCRDDVDICKHYKGGPEKECFKGKRCKKKHVVKHPDGWTLDRVSVAGKCPTPPLPAPDTWHKVHVSCVVHLDCVYVQLHKDERREQPELPSYGVVVPPASLEALVRDMNSPAARVSYKPLTLAPAPGELVAARYPLDDQWYRARVLTSGRADQSVEVQYVDYGNALWVKEDATRALEPRHCVLPQQAVRCVLAGVVARGEDSRQWARAREHLARLALDRTLDARVVGREYDELIIELIDAQGYSVAEQLAALDLVELRDYAVVDDAAAARRHVAP